MESGIQSSFIPQDAATPTAPRAERSGGLSDLLFLISIVLLVASGALAGAVFLYKEYVATSAASKVEALKRAQGAFEPSLVQDITRLDDRMQAADQVLGAHTAPTALFQALETATLSTISFQTLDFEAPDSQHITVKMTGVAESVNSIALQADVLSKDGVLTNPIFSDISRQADGVHFSLTALVNPAAISYVQKASGAGTAQVLPNSTQSQGQPPQSQSTPFGAPSQGATTKTQTGTQGTGGTLPTTGGSGLTE